MADGQTLNVTIRKDGNERLGLGCAATKKGDVRVSSLAGAAARNGQLKVGDIILTINKAKIGTLKDVSDAMRAWNNTGDLNLTLCRPKEAAELGKAEVTSFTTDVILKDYEEGDPIGAFIDKSFVVTKVVAGTPSDGVLQLGDKVLAVAGWALKDEKEFYMKLMRSAPSCKLKIERKGVPGATAKPASQQVAPDAPSFESGDSKVSTVEVTVEKDQPLGIVPDESLEVVRVQEGTVGAKHFHVGDIIMKVNEEPVTDLNHFHDLLDKLTGTIKVTINESVSRTCSMEVQKLPDNIEKMIQRHAGFDYRIVEMNYDEKSGKPYGLALANCAHNQVIVTSLKEGSFAADKFKVYDRVLMINGTPVTDENVAKEYICAAGGNFQAVVERPSTAERWTEIRNKHQAFMNQARRPRKAEDELPTDAMMICQAYSQKRKAKQLKAAKFILKAKPADPQKGGKRLTFNEQRNVVEIVSDVPPTKQLRRCG